ALARVYKKPRPWTYWGYRPAPRPANAVPWDRTESIARVLDRLLADPDPAVRMAVLRRMLREHVPTRLETLRHWLRDESQPESVAAILDALHDHPAEHRRDLLAEAIAGRSQTPANRLKALALWTVGSAESGDGRLLGLAGSLEMVQSSRR